MDERYELKFAGLLHDIGKMVQRTQNNFTESHEDMGYNYLEKNKILKEYLGEKILSAIKEHHNRAQRKQDHSLTYKHFTNAVIEADWADSGQNRYNELDETEEQYQKTREHTLKLFFTNKTENPLHVRPLRYTTILEDARHFYPEIKRYLPGQLYIQNLYESEGEYIASLTNTISKDKDPDNNFRNMLLLIKDICYNLPASTWQGQNKYSLYAHMKNVAALSDIYNTSAEKNKILFLFFEFNSIQKFIVGKAEAIKEEQKTKELAKLTRGRSLLMDFLTEAIVEEILYKTSCSRDNVVMSGASKAMLMLPNTQENQEKVKQVLDKTNQWLLDNNPYLTISYGTYYASFEELKTKKEDPKPMIRNLLKKIGENLAINRRNLLRNIENPEKTMLETDVKKKYSCPYCGQPVESKNTECKMCTLAKKIGSKQVDDKKEDEELFLVFGEVNVKEPTTIDLPTSNKIYLVDNIDDIEKGKVIAYPSTKKLLKAQKQKKGYIKELFDKIKDKDIGLEVLVRPYINTPPLNIVAKKIKNKEREEKDKSKEEDFAKLIHIKADVDNLGRYFVSSNEKDVIQTLAEYATMSYHLELFFFNHLSKLLYDLNKEQVKENGYTREEEHYNGRYYTVYIGGDDVYLILNEQYAFDWLKKINEHFRKFYNESLSCSYGLYRCKHKYPFYKASEHVDEEESLAKNIDRGKINEKDPKNAISFNKRPLKNKEFFEELLEQRDWLLEKKLSRRYLYRIYQLMKRIKKNDDEETRGIKLTKAKTYLIYMIARAQPDDKNLINSGLRQMLVEKLTTSKKDYFCNLLYLTLIKQTYMEEDKNDKK